MADGATQPTDIVELRSPFGLLGTVADRLVLSHYQPRILRQRNTSLKNTLEARGQGAKAVPGGRVLAVSGG